MTTALQFAIERHQGQMYGPKPYVTGHLCPVAVLVVSSGFPELEDAAYLHDVAEDTATTIEEVQDEFGPETAVLVWAVTSEPGKNRKERHTATYPKIARVGTKAIALKLCDRIVNVEECLATEDAKLQMYRKEHVDFRAALYQEDSDPRVLALWARLDELLGGYDHEP